MGNPEYKIQSDVPLNDADLAEVVRRKKMRNMIQFMAAPEQTTAISDFIKNPEHAARITTYGNITAYDYENGGVGKYTVSVINLMRRPAAEESVEQWICLAPHGLAELYYDFKEQRGSLVFLEPSAFGSHSQTEIFTEGILSNISAEDFSKIAHDGLELILGERPELTEDPVQQIIVTIQPPPTYYFYTIKG